MRESHCHSRMGKPKIRFKSREAARDFLVQHHQSQTMKVYKCPDCHQWHLAMR